MLILDGRRHTDQDVMAKPNSIGGNDMKKDKEVKNRAVEELERILKNVELEKHNMEEKLASLTTEIGEVNQAIVAIKNVNKGFFSIGKEGKQKVCPKGFIFGKDCEMFDACDKCALWDECFAEGVTYRTGSCSKNVVAKVGNLKSKSNKVIDTRIDTNNEVTCSIYRIKTLSRKVSCKQLFYDYHSINDLKPGKIGTRDYRLRYKRFYSKLKNSGEFLSFKEGANKEVYFSIKEK